MLNIIQSIYTAVMDENNDYQDANHQNHFVFATFIEQPTGVDFSHDSDLRGSSLNEYSFNETQEMTRYLLT